MSRKRTSLRQSINSLAASIPDIPVPGDHLGDANKMIQVEAIHEPEIPISVHPVLERIYEQLENNPNDGNRLINIFPPPPSPLNLFTTWSRTPEGHRVTDSRIPTDPVRLGCILDDNARIAFMAGYAAATPSFE